MQVNTTTHSNRSFASGSNKAKTNWLLLYLLLFVATLCCGATTHFPGAEDVRNIHVVYIMDTDNKKLDNFIKSTTSAVQQELYSIQNATKGRIQKHYITGSKFNSQDCYSTLTSLSVNPLQDIVIVVLVAHGNSSSSADEYPNIRFSDSDRRNYQDIMDLILVHRPAYLLSIVNSCNNPVNARDVEISRSVQIQTCDDDLGDLGNQEQAYSHLFIPQSATIAITYLSSQKGTSTIITQKGASAFRAFMSAIRHCTTNSTQPSWSEILLKAQSLTICLTETNSTKIECPYAELLKVVIENDEILTEGQGVYFCNQ